MRPGQGTPGCFGVPSSFTGKRYDDTGRWWIFRILQKLYVCEYNHWKEVPANIVLSESKSPQGMVSICMQGRELMLVFRLQGGRGRIGACCPETQAWRLWTGRQLHTELWIKTPSRLHQGTVTWAHWSLLFRVSRFFSGVKWEATVIGLCEVNWSQLWETPWYAFQRRVTQKSLSTASVTAIVLFRCVTRHENVKSKYVYIWFLTHWIASRSAWFHGLTRSLLKMHTRTSG